MGGGKKKKNKPKKNDQTPMQTKSVQYSFIDKKKAKVHKLADVKQEPTALIDSIDVEQVMVLDEVKQSTSVGPEELDRDDQQSVQQNENWLDNDEPISPHTNSEENSETSKENLGNVMPNTGENNESNKGLNKQNRSDDCEKKSKETGNNKDKNIDEKSSTGKNSEDSKLHTGNSGKGRGKRLQEYHNKNHRTENENSKIGGILRSANQENDSTKNYSSERNRDYSSPDTSWWHDQSKPERSPWDNKSSSKSEHSSGESGKPRRDSSPNKNNSWESGKPRRDNSPHKNDSWKSSKPRRDYSPKKNDSWESRKPRQDYSSNKNRSWEGGKPRRDNSPHKNDSWESGNSRRDYSPNKNDSWDSGKPRQDYSSNKNNSWESGKPKRDYSPNKNSSWESGKSRRDFSPNKNYQGNSEDKEYRYFFDNYRKFSINYAKVKEIEGDLFAMTKEYALAHCVAEDMSMGSGIAVQFSQQFKGRGELCQQKQRQGGMAILEIDQRPIYYLVTKKLSNGKPTYATLWSSLQKMQKHIEENKVKKLALPRIGCGLDRLEWSIVKPMLEYIFKDTDIEITVCNFQQQEDDSSSTPSSSQQKANKRCPVKNVEIPLVQIDRLTAIVYLGSEDGYITEEIASLNTKFRTVSKDYGSANKKVGDVVQTWTNQFDYALYGCIVKKTKDDPFDFINFQKCIARLKSLNSKDNMFYYVGIQAFLDESDDLIMDKIVNMLRCSLINVEIYVCWPGKMKPFMPQNYYY